MKERNRKRHKARGGGAVKRALALIMAFNMAFGLIPETPFVMKAKAADPVSVKTITGLGTGAITNPVQPAERGSAWSGSYVYYGIYDNSRLEKSRYRVLDRASGKFGVEGGSLFLDCDKIIYKEKFSTADSEKWASSDIKASLNGEAFLTKPGNFTDVERNAIAESRVEAHPLTAGNGAGQVDSYSKNEFVNYTALNGEKVFLLDVEDASNIAYGYSTTSYTAQNKVKTGTYDSWWLRSADKDPSYHIAGLINSYGLISLDNVNGNMPYGVSPAFNLSLSSVLFSSLISGNAGEAGAEYKLTLKDGDISIAAGSGGTWDASGLVSIPYSITDNSSTADPTQVSAVVTDGTWTGDGWSEGAKLLQYAKLETESLGTSGTGTFTLDSSISGTWGSDYHVYILAEDVNGEKETDYASVPVEIKAVTVIAAGFNGEYDGQTHKADITVAGPADGWTLRYGEAADACTSEESPALTDVSDSPRIIYYQVTADGYLTATGSVTIQIAKATPDFIAPSKIDRLRYNGQERELVTAGSTNFGKVLYSLDGTNYSEEIPRGTEAGTYTVYYKVEGGDNWKAIDAQMVEVTIAEPISYPVIGLGLGTISNPKAPETDNSPWSGSFVYYGIYNGIPTKFRVLDKASDKFGVVGGSLFLDCDSTLYGAKFDKDAAPNQDATTANAWAYSDIKADLNGDSFLTKSGNFTEVEKNAIAESTVESHQLESGTGAGQVAYDTLGYCTEYTALAGEKIFLLDYEDASNIAYGYSTTDDAAKNRKKVGSNIEWWLRSPSKGNSTYAGNVDGYGNLCTYWVSFSIGVSPAFNVSLSSILLSSMIAGEDGQPGAEYKLTLKDSGLSIEAESGTRDANGKISIPYRITDNSSTADPTQVSMVVTDGTWTGDGWSEGAKLLQYAKLEMESWGLSGIGAFTPDSSKVTGVCGTDYHIYILAEDVNGAQLTNYASEPVEIAIKSRVSFDANGGSGTMEAVGVEKNAQYVLPDCSFTAPEGKTFDRWQIGDDTENLKAAGDVISITDDVVIKAIYKVKTIVINTISKVDTNGNQINGDIEGTGGYLFGSRVTFTAPKVEGYNFVGWYRHSDASPYYTGEKLGSANTYTFTATEDADYTAVYEARGKASITIGGGSSFTINGSEKSSQITADYTLGSTITVSVTADDFAYWANSYGMVLSREKTYSFTVTGADTVTAVFDTVIENKATVIFESAYGQVMARDQLAENETMTIPGLPTLNGYNAIGWDLNGDGSYDAVSDTLAAALERGLAAEKKTVTIKPIYELKNAQYSISVTNGSGAGEYGQNTIVTVTANAPEEGHKFSHWKDESGKILSYDTTYEFYAEKDTSLEAVYVEATAVVEAKGTTEIINMYKDTDKLIFVSMSTVPEGCTINKAGVIATNDSGVGNSGDGFNASTASFVRGNAWNGSAYRYTWTKSNVGGGETWYVRAYLVYTDASGNSHTVYGDMVSQTN